MNFKVEPNEEFNIEPMQGSGNEYLYRRWSVMGHQKIGEITGSSFEWHNELNSIINQRTNIDLGFDNFVGRPVIIKTVKYRPNDLASTIDVIRSRKVLVEQMNILNDLNTPLLPEPLAWFTMENNVDAIPYETKDTEPILILDYIAGETLQEKVKNKDFRFIQNSSISGMNMLKVVKLMKKILYFLKLLEKKGYAYIGLNLEHIIILQDYMPRFVGLGRICKMTNGHLDATSINFGRTVFGYSAPELNDPKNNWGESSKAREIGAYSLGVIFHQILCESVDFEDGTILNGVFRYPNGITENKIMQLENGKHIHELIEQLCEVNPENRLVDYEEIEERLAEMESYILTGSHKYAKINLPPKRVNLPAPTNKKIEKEDATISEDVEGEIKFFDYAKGFGFLEDIENKNEYYISKEVMEKANLYSLNENTKVIFDIVRENGELCVKNLRQDVQIDESDERTRLGKLLGKLFNKE